MDPNEMKIIVRKYQVQTIRRINNKNLNEKLKK